MSRKIPVSTLVLVHTPELRVLLLERADFPGFWQSVTGSQEDAESLAQTATRELKEETGIDAATYGGVVDWQLSNVYEIYPRWRHRYPEGTTHNTEHVFTLEVPIETPDLLPFDDRQGCVEGIQVSDLNVLRVVIIVVRA